MEKTRTKMDEVSTEDKERLFNVNSQQDLEDIESELESIETIGKVVLAGQAMSSRALEFVGKNILGHANAIRQMLPDLLDHLKAEGNPGMGMNLKGAPLGSNPVS